MYRSLFRLRASSPTLSRIGDLVTTPSYLTMKPELIDLLGSLYSRPLVETVSATNLLSSIPINWDDDLFEVLKPSLLRVLSEGSESDFLNMLLCLAKLRASCDLQISSLATERATSLVHALSFPGNLSLIVALSQLSLRSPELFSALADLEISSIPVKYLPSLFLAIATLGLQAPRLVDAICVNLEISSMTTSQLIDTCVASATLGHFPVSLASKIEQRVLSGNFNFSESLEICWLLCVLDFQKSQACSRLVLEISSWLPRELEDLEERQLSQLSVSTDLKFPVIEEFVPDYEDEICDCLEISNREEPDYCGMYCSDAPKNNWDLFIILDRGAFPESVEPIDPYTRLKLRQVSKAGRKVVWLNFHSWRLFENDQDRRDFILSQS